MQLMRFLPSALVFIAATNLASAALACVTNAECEDGNFCTIDTCNASNLCVRSAAAVGTSCPSGVCSSLQACVQCINDSQCGGLAPTCDTTINACVACVGASCNVCDPSAWYEREFDSLDQCSANERPHWLSVEWSAVFPAATRIEIVFTHAENPTDLTNASYPRTSKIVIDNTSGMPAASGVGRQGVISIEDALSASGVSANIYQDPSLPGFALGLVHAELFTDGRATPTLRRLETRFVCMNVQ